MLLGVRIKAQTLNLLVSSAHLGEGENEQLES